MLWLDLTGLTSSALLASVTAAIPDGAAPINIHGGALLTDHIKDALLIGAAISVGAAPDGLRGRDAVALREAATTIRRRLITIHRRCAVCADRAQLAALASATLSVRQAADGLGHLVNAVAFGRCARRAVDVALAIAVFIDEGTGRALEVLKLAALPRLTITIREADRILWGQLAADPHRGQTGLTLDIALTIAIFVDEGTLWTINAEVLEAGLPFGAVCIGDALRGGRGARARGRRTWRAVDIALAITVFVDEGARWA